MSTETQMELLDIVTRKAVPAPWEEGENIPWNDRDFSERMLKEHLSQTHDLASRRADTIDKHVEWIHGQLLGERPARILDLACGPGLYSNRLARLGHECVGIDFSPASIDYATNCAQKENLACTYSCEDIRETECGEGFDLVMFIFGEFNVFRPSDVADILGKARGALVDGGQLLLEPASVDCSRKEGCTWYSAENGLFSDRPHLCIEETIWEADSRTTTTRFYIVDASSNRVTRYAITYQAYTDAEYSDLLVKSGFGRIEFFPALAGAVGEPRGDLIAVAARKG